jgi:hypothetical protein
MLVFVVKALKKKNLKIAVWALAPLLVLSTLPHKESRYLIPVSPFISILAGIGLWHWLKDINCTSLNLSKRKIMIPLLLLFTFSISFVFEADGFRFRRSEAGVDVAKYIRKHPNITSIAIEQSWRLGGKIYLQYISNFLEISPDSIGDLKYFKGILTTPGLQLVALKEKDLKKYNYLPLLEREGFKEQIVNSVKRDKYCMFIKINKNIPPKTKKKL